MLRNFRTNEIHVLCKIMNLDFAHEACDRCMQLKQPQTTFSICQMCWAAALLHKSMTDSIRTSKIDKYNSAISMTFNR